VQVNGPQPRDIAVVAIGGDIGVYAMCRAFHEAFGANSVVLSTVSTRPMERSAFIENVVAPGLADDETLIKALETQAERLAKPGRQLVLLTNSDWHVHTIAANRERLEAAGYFFQYPTPEVLSEVSTKAGFAEVCSRLDIPTPGSVPVNIRELVAGNGKPDDVAVPFAFPVIAKPSDSSQWQELSFSGKQKIHTLNNRQELDELLGKLIEANYPGVLLVQEYIPGDETQQRSMTAYRDSAGNVTLLASGRVLLEEHTPGTLGIPAAILTEPYEDAFEAATRFLNEVGYTGFANFDFKRDSRDGRHVFFEVNPRIGRNNYYVTAAGANTAEVLVADVIDGATTEVPRRADKEVLYTVIPFNLLQRYIVDPELLARLKKVVARGGLANPLKYKGGDSGLWRRLIVAGISLAYRRKYHQFYPKPLDG